MSRGRKKAADERREGEGEGEGLPRRARRFSRYGLIILSAHNVQRRERNAVKLAIKHGMFRQRRLFTAALTRAGLPFFVAIRKSRVNETGPIDLAQVIYHLSRNRSSSLAIFNNPRV